MPGAENTSVAAPLVSIIMPCVGMLEYTKLCVPSVLEHSREPIELIFVDIGSLDGTVEYLAGLRAGLRGSMRVEVCRAATDLEIGQACREALDKAKGAYVCLLNNDTVVTAKWLDGLTGLVDFTEATDLGLFDTDILSAKAQQAGFSLAVCRDLFVHHFGTRTFAHGLKTATHPANAQTMS